MSMRLRRALARKQRRRHSCGNARWATHEDTQSWSSNRRTTRPTPNTSVQVEHEQVMSSFVFSNEQSNVRLIDSISLLLRRCV